MFQKAEHSSEADSENHELQYASCTTRRQLQNNGGEVLVS
jgi:hypothetical protein